MSTIGEVVDITREFIFEWRIDNFFSLSEECYDSPSFTMHGESWYLSICPNGTSEDNSVGYISVYLYRNESGPSKSLAWSFALRTVDGKKDYEMPNSRVFIDAGGHGYPCFMQRSELLKNKSKLVPSGLLTIVCTIELCLKSTDEEATKLLVDDLSNIFHMQEHSDIIIKVKDREFKLHRVILAGRNPYFKALMNSEMKEKATGIVSIDDCEPDIFGIFIQFVYTGKVDLNVENVCDVYVLSDKYQEDWLKKKCVQLMRNEICVDNFCDFIELSLKYDEKQLFKEATDLFRAEIKDIIKSVKWQSFMRQYPTQANELTIKAVEHMSSKLQEKTNET